MPQAPGRDETWASTPAVRVVSQWRGMIPWRGFAESAEFDEVRLRIVRDPNVHCSRVVAPPAHGVVAGAKDGERPAIEHHGGDCPRWLHTKPGWKHPALAGDPPSRSRSRFKRSCSQYGLAKVFPGWCQYLTQSSTARPCSRAAGENRRQNSLHTQSFRGLPFLVKPQPRRRPTSPAPAVLANKVILF